MLHEFLTENAQEIIARTRAKVAARMAPRSDGAELENGVPLLLEQIIDQLRLTRRDGDEIQSSAARQGGELLAMGFTVSQVVHGYGDVCQVVTRLADETDAEITAEEFHTFNRCLDEAIAHAVTEYQHQRDESFGHVVAESQRRREESSAGEATERLGALAHELRNRLAAATLSYGILRGGTVAIGGSTGAVLGRNLAAMQTLINNSLAGVRLDAGLSQRRRVAVAELVGDAEVEAAMQAQVGGFDLAVAPVAPGIDVEVDPQIVAAALGNLLQNAFKFSHPRGLISLRATATGDRVLLEVEDECGGLPPGAEDLFHPFAQRGADRTGLGLGLSISRKGVEAMGGTLGVRDLPGKGCVFSIDLPRLPEA